MLGRFTILRPLGAGGQGRVVAVRDAARDDAVVALKETPRRDADALRREFALLAKLRHPNLVAVYDWFDPSPFFDATSALADETPAAYTQELVDGVDLWRALREADLDERERVFEQVLRALAYLHALDVAHLDMKPENVLVSRADDGTSLARVLDFGIARRIGEQVTSVKGSYSYVAPERLAGQGFDQRADLYALGVMMAEVAIGRPPPPEALRGELADAGARRTWLLGEGVPERWLELVTSLLSADPARRPSGAWEVARLWGRERRQPVVLHTAAAAASMVRAGSPVGRDAALERCRAAVDTGGAVVLTGPAGIGRATVARAAAHEAQIGGHAVELWPHGPRSRTARGLGESLARLLDDPALASLVLQTSQAPRAASRGVPGREDEGARYTAWVEQTGLELAEHLLARTPPARAPVLVVTDLDGAPSVPRALLRALVTASERGRRLPLSLILCAADHAGAAAVRLSPLGREAVERFVATRFGSEAADPRPCAALAAASGGHPLHLETLAALVVARGALRFGPDGWSWAGDPDALVLPEQLEDAVRERVAALPEVAQAALGATVWLRFPASPDAVAAALDLKRPPLEALLELEAAGLLWRDGQGRFRPAHARVAAGHSDFAPPGGADAAHARVRDRVRREPLAHAWHLGGREGATVARELGRQAWAERRAEAAAEALDLALELAPEEPEALTLRAEVADLLGPRELQVACLDRLVAALPADDPRTLQARSRAFWTLTRIGDVVRAEAAGREVVALARARDAREILAEALVHLAIIVTQRGDYDESERLLREAAERAAETAGDGEAAGGLGLRARIANNLGNVLSYREQHEAALAQYTEAYRLKSEEGDPVGQRIAGGNMGLMCLRLGRPAEAMAHFAASWEAARKTGHRRGEAWSLCVFGEVGLEAGAWRFAERRARAALRVAEELGDQLIACDSETTMAESLLAQGRVDAATRRARSGLERARAVESGYTAARARLLLASLATDDDPSTAAAEAEAVAADTLADDVTRARAERLSAELALARGELDVAEAAARRSLAVGGRGLQPGVYATAVRVLRACGAGREADRVLAEGRRRSEEIAEAWPERAAADAVEPESAFDGPSRATWEGRSDVRALMELGPGATDEEAPAAVVASATDDLSGGEMSSSILTCLATCDAAGLERAAGAWLAEIVERYGAERAFVVVGEGEGEVFASRDADGEAVADAARKLPAVAVEQARARGAVWRATGASGRGALVGIPLTAGDEAAVVVLQNRFVAEAFADLPAAPPDVAPLAALLRVRALELGREALKTQLREAEERRREAHTRSTEELLSLRRELESTREQVGPARSYPNIVFTSTRMKKMLRQVDRVVDTDLPVYVHGESGTGKELVARALHDLGPRGRGPFVAQNVSAIPATLFESELFGHERGAFTGANRSSEGLFRRASGGTLFLDEIGDMPLDLQAKLLRVLETSEVRAVGGTRSVRVDVRVISATHHDLKELVREGRFREDLFYRLNVIRIEVPPLRERPDDIPVLVEHFLSERAGSLGERPEIGEGVMKALVAYAWPGNVRQLENEVTRAALLADDGVIRTRDLTPEVAEARGGRRGGGSGALAGRLGLDRGTLKERVDRLEALVLEESLARTGNNKSQVARELGLSRAGLNMKLKRLGLWADDD